MIEYKIESKKLISAKIVVADGGGKPFDFLYNIEETPAGVIIFEKTYGAKKLKKTYPSVDAAKLDLERIYGVGRFTPSYADFLNAIGVKNGD